MAGTYEEKFYMIQELNFITEKEQQVVDEEILNNTYFPWYYNEWSSSEDYPFYGHILAGRYEQTPDHDDGKKRSNISSGWFEFFYQIVERFIDKYKIFNGEIEILRASLNDSLNFDDKQYDAHVDYEEEHLIFILYLTDSSGDTVIYKDKWEEGRPPIYFNRDGHPEFEIEDSISPEKGKMICYDGLSYHTSIFRKDKERRVICIFNCY